jgi:hypothetical protein
VTAPKSKDNPFLVKMKKTGLFSPFWLAVAGFFLGGPITGAVLFFLWRQPWSEKTKVYSSVIFILVFDLLQLFFAKQVTVFTLQAYQDLIKTTASK